jgi:hypothetical protein
MPMELLTNDAGTMRMTTAATFKTYFQTGVTASSIAADNIAIGDAAVTLSTSSGNITIDATANDTDIIFKGTDNSSDITMLTLDGSDAGSATFNHDIILGNNGILRLGDAGENIVGDGTDLTVNSSNDLHLTATTDINIPANVGLTFGDDGEKIEGDGTDLTISGNDIKLDAADNVDIDSDTATRFLDNGTLFATLSNASGISFTCNTSDGDINLRGSDGGSFITALTLDMSAAGAATFNDDVTVGDDLNLTTDSAVINFGADSDTTLTHTDGTGLTLNSTNKLCFNDTGTFIHSNADGDLDLSSDGTANDSIKLTSAGAITLDANSTSGTGSIRLDSAYGEIALMKAGTTFGTFFNNSSNLRIRSSISDADITFSGNDGGASITALTLDMSAAGAATFNSSITSGAGLVIADAGNIGSASDTDAISIASNGVVTFSQAPVFPDGSIAVADLDIDGGTDIGEAIVDADLFIIDNGAGGTNRKTAASRLVTYIDANSSAASVGKAIAMAIVFG